MNPTLLAKYDQRVPRYTSYPTAPHFHPGIDAGCYESWLAALSPDEPASLYLHVPFCAELCHYCGCHTTAVHRYEPVAHYAGLIEREIDLVADAIGADSARRRQPVSHIHWGGGTPTMLRPDELRRISAKLGARFAIRPDAEIAVEIDPRTLTLAGVGALAASGVTRASLGVQDFHPAVQRAINRVQSYDETARAARWLRRAGIRAINLDLMYGLPHQTADSVVATVEQALTLQPDRIALFGYAHVPWMKRHQRLLPEDALPDAAARFAQREAAAARIAAAGFVPIGLDHFARPDDPMARSLAAGTLRRNFQGYTTDGAPALIGFGASSIGGLPQGYVQNEPSIPGYGAAIRSGRLATVRGVAIDEDDRLRREIIERLMCDFTVDLDAVCARHGSRDAASRFAAERAAIDRLAADGIVERDGARIAVTALGRPLVRAVCAAFDRYLAAGADKHSRAI